MAPEGEGRKGNEKEEVDPVGGLIMKTFPRNPQIFVKSLKLLKYLI